MRFSIVIPLYNKEQYIAETLDSVKKQSFDDFEVNFNELNELNNNINKIVKKSQKKRV